MLKELMPLRGPEFSSYAPNDVGWLLTDLSRVAKDESASLNFNALADEYQPSDRYHEIFFRLLEHTASRIAYTVGILTELVVAERGSDVVLASFLRAGIPLGILMRRWSAYAHGRSLDHYAMSPDRNVGIDPVAMRWLATHYDPAKVVFVDGWTGKGRIARMLSLAVAAPDVPAGFDPSLAVLADPAGSVGLYGTRDELLIPFALMNSTSSGLISRAVPRHELIEPGGFYGARFYDELASSDVSELIIDTVSEKFAVMADKVAADWIKVAHSDRTPNWKGKKVSEEIAKRYGIADSFLVRPGFCETLRALLGPLTDRVLIDPAAEDQLDSVLLLAEQRRIPIVRETDLPFYCVAA